MRNLYCNVWRRVALPVAGALLLGACQKQEEVAPPREKVTLTAVAGQTRTSLGSDDAVQWSAGDTFRLFGDSGASEQFVLTDGAGTSTASFEGYLPDGESYFAIYPESSVIEADSYGYMQMNLPHEQVYVRGSFAENVNPMAAWASGEVSQLNFRNLCGVMELQVSGEGTLASVTLSSNQTMSGRMAVSMFQENSDAVMLITTTPQGVEMTGINEPLSAEPLSLYFVVPAGTYEALTVTMTDASGAVIVRTATDPVTIRRSVITPVEGLVFEASQAETVTVAMTIDETASDWKATYVNYEKVGNVATDNFKCCALRQADLDGYLASGYDLKTILATLATKVYAFDENGHARVGWITPVAEPQSFLAGMIIGEEVIGEVARLDYTSEGVTDDSSLGFDPEWTIGDTYIGYTATVSGGATRIYAFLGQGDIWATLSDEDIISQIIARDPAGTELTGTTYTDRVDNLVPDMVYEWCVLLEGPNGTKLFRFPLNTLPLQEGEDTAEYRQFLGTWELQYDDLLGWGYESVTVTVEQATVGRTYWVSGMMGSTADGYRVDDTIEAWFENGQIVFRGATLVADAGSFDDVAFYPFGKDLSTFDPTARYIGTYADDTVTFANSVATNINACGFITFSGDYVAYGSNVYGNLVWTREPSVGQGQVAVVEQFVRRPVFNPVWE